MCLYAKGRKTQGSVREMLQWGIYILYGECMGVCIFTKGPGPRTPTVSRSKKDTASQPRNERRPLFPQLCGYFLLICVPAVVIAPCHALMPWPSLCPPPLSVPSLSSLFRSDKGHRFPRRRRSSRRPRLPSLFHPFQGLLAYDARPLYARSWMDLLTVASCSVFSFSAARVDSTSSLGALSRNALPARRFSRPCDNTTA